MDLIQNIAFSYFWAYTIYLVVALIIVLSNSDKLDRNNEVKISQGKYNPLNLTGLICLTLFILSTQYK